MTIRSFIAALSFSLTALPLCAQDLSRAEVALDYNYVRTNAPPSGCGCFSMNGGSGSFAFRFTPSLAAVEEVGAVHAGNVDSSGLDLTLTSFLVGPRFSFSLPRGPFVPYAQILVGGVHASGAATPANTVGSASSTAFAATVGGGIDWRLSHHFAIRPIQAEYFVTKLANGTNDHQNNLRIGSGLVVHF